MRLRPARADEAEWINARYAAVGFVPSDLARELVLVAEIDDLPAGLGRLVPIDASSCELGGMLVFDEFRGRGVARALVDALLQHANGRDVYCLPFAHLEPMYAAAGFTRSDRAPADLMKKWEWCNETYEHEVLLMSRSAAAEPPP